LRRQAATHIDDEDDRIRLGHRLARLLGHLLDDAGDAVGLEPAGIDDDELARTQTGVAVVAITRQAGKVGDDGIAAFRDAVEQRRLPDVRPAHQGDDRLHDDAQKAISWAGRRTARHCVC
jgi:hypothetical protein